MVPSTFVQLDALPLNGSGKVDLQMLPAPPARRPDLAEAFVPPSTPAEKVIAGIWSEVLRVDEVGTDDCFFDLGGHSLLATQVMSRVNQTFGSNLPLRCLFEALTIAELAKMVGEPAVAAAGATAAIRQAPRVAHPPRGFANERSWNRS
jgi:acyl carrier protein